MGYFLKMMSDYDRLFKLKTGLVRIKNWLIQAVRASNTVEVFDSHD